MPFKFTQLKIKDVILIEPKVFADNRGYFMETYKYSDFSKNGISENFVQDNQSKSSKNVLRGLHYQMPPYGQGKLVRCIKGEIFDVAVDIRENSPTFGQWVGEYISEENRKMLYIPDGFAHGFLTMTDYAEIHYKMTKEYAQEFERGILWNDKDINIQWPINSSNNIILSEKDMKNPSLNYKKG